MPDPAPAAPSAPAPGSLTGVRYDQPISDAQFDRLGPADQSRFMRVRNQNNDPEWQPRTDGPSPAPAAAPKPATPGEPAPAPAASAVDGKLRIGEGENAFELTPDDVKMLVSEKAARDLRATKVPSDPSGYELPEYKLEDGLRFSFNPNDATINDLRRWAHSQQFSSDQWTQMLNFHAQSEMAKERAYIAACKAEVEKLGIHGTARVTAVENFLRGQLGDDLGNALRSMIVTEKIVRGLEALAAKFTTQGAAGFSQAHRHVEPPRGPGIASDAEYEAMTQSERWAYARSHSEARKNGSGER